MKLEFGKRYVLRNGEVVGPLTDYNNLDFRFTDANARDSFGRQLSWRIDGTEQIDSHQSMYDIVAEYVEPQPQQPLRWVENCKPDKPGIWAYKNGLDETRAALFDADDIQTCHSQQWCYLGPIPEILPPVKKVVERLWITRLGTSGWPATYDEQWVIDTHPDPEEGDWIRTDRTREVER